MYIKKYKYVQYGVQCKAIETFTDDDQLSLTVEYPTGYNGSELTTHWDLTFEQWKEKQIGNVVSEDYLWVHKEFAWVKVPYALDTAIVYDVKAITLNIEYNPDGTIKTKELDQSSNILETIKALSVINKQPKKRIRDVFKRKV